MPTFDEEEKKRIIKEAINEWLDQKFIDFGKWSAAGILAAALAALAVFIVHNSNK